MNKVQILDKQLLENKCLRKTATTRSNRRIRAAIIKNIVLILMIVGVQTLMGQENKDKDPFTFGNGTTRIKLGGYVQALAAFDFNGSIANHDFIVSTMPIPKNWEQRQRFAVDATSTRLNLEVTHNTESIGDIKFFIETDFRGAANVLRLRHAYISLLGIIAGQTWTFMYDPDAMAPIIDQQGVNARAFFRTPLIGYTYKSKKGISAGISVEFPAAKITTAKNIASATQTIPDIPVFFQYKAAKGHIKLAGVFRNITYGDTAQKKIKITQGWGIQLSGSVKPASFLTLCAQGIYGQGAARYINDMAALSLDLLPDYTNPGRVNAPNMFSASIGLRVDIIKKIYITSNFGIAQLEKNTKYVKGSDFRHSQYFSASLFWKIYNNFLFAAEYLYGYRLNMNADFGNANRIQTIIRYNF